MGFGQNSYVTVGWPGWDFDRNASYSRAGPNNVSFNHVHISFEAAEAIGRVIQPILISPKVTDRLKLELLGVVLTSLRDLERRADLQPLATVLRENLINPYGLGSKKSYLDTLKEYVDGQDHVLLAELRRFRGELSAAIAAES